MIMVDNQVYKHFLFWMLLQLIFYANMRIVSKNKYCQTKQ